MVRLLDIKVISHEREYDGLANRRAGRRPSVSEGARCSRRSRMIAREMIKAATAVAARIVKNQNNRFPRSKKA